MTSGLLQANATVNEHSLMAGWESGWGREAKVVFDDRTDDHMVVALKNKPGSLYGHALCYQLAN